MKATCQGRENVASPRPTALKLLEPRYHHAGGLHSHQEQNGASPQLIVIVAR